MISITRFGCKMVLYNNIYIRFLFLAYYKHLAAPRFFEKLLQNGILHLFEIYATSLREAAIVFWFLTFKLFSEIVKRLGAVDLKRRQTTISWRRVVSRTPVWWIVQTSFRTIKDKNVKKNHSNKRKVKMKSEKEHGKKKCCKQKQHGSYVVAFSSVHNSYMFSATHR